MRTLRLVLVGAVISVALAVGTTGIAVAQTEADDEAVPVDPSADVTGVSEWTENNAHQMVENAEPPLDFTVSNRGATWAFEMDDPRLSGQLETNRTLHQYDSGVNVATGIGRLTNEGGSWDAAIHTFYGPTVSSRMVMYLTGVGGYEGLHAVLLMTYGGQLEGVIVPAPWPEPPGSLLPPAE